MKNKELKRNRIKILNKIFSWIAILAVLLILYGTVRIIYYTENLKESDKLYSELNSNIVHIKSEAEHAKIEQREEEMISPFVMFEPETVDSKEEPKPLVIKEYTLRYTGDWTKQVSVDLNSLVSQNPDIKGWLFFENEDLSFPIMYSGDNEKYLRTTFDGKNSKAGSIFIEGMNAPDFSDSHTIIYGHSMKNGSMFGKLKEYVNQPNYYEYHKYFQIITLNEDGTVQKERYKIFSYFKTEPDSPVYTVISGECNEFTDMIQYMQGNNLCDCKDFVSKEDKIITVSTCSSGDKRLTLNAYLVDSIKE